VPLGLPATLLVSDAFERALMPTSCVALMERHVDALVSAFSADFYIDEDAARSAIKSQRMFNLMHLDSAIKVDLIVRKNSDYRKAEFERRKLASLRSVSLNRDVGRRRRSVRLASISL